MTGWLRRLGTIATAILVVIGGDLASAEDVTPLEAGVDSFAKAPILVALSEQCTGF